MTIEATSQQAREELPAQADGRAMHGHLSEQTGFRWMYVADAASLYLSMLLIAFARWGTEWPNYSTTDYLVGFGVVAVIHIVTAYFGGLYDRDHRLGGTSRLPRVASLTATAVLIDAALSLGADKFLMPRLNLAAFVVVATLALAFNRWLAQRVMARRFGQPRVLLVGNPDDIKLAESHLSDRRRDPVVVGWRASSENLAEAVEELQATDVLLLSGVQLDKVYPAPLESFEARRVGVYHRLSPSDTLLGVKKTRQIAGMPFVALRSHTLPHSRARFKRLLDLLYLFLALPVLIPLMAFVVIYARIAAGGPVFYRQDRLGRYGVPFSIVKIRTMYMGSEDRTGPVLAAKDDDRVIPSMAWMRRTRFDELPQLWNVLRGDMSLVGPRPERGELAEGFEVLIPGYGRRHDTRPGITGLAQVNGDYHTDPGFKLGHDLQYLVNWSPILDLQIMFRTIYVVLAGRV